MAMAFWDFQRILFVDYMAYTIAINGDAYAVTLWKLQVFYFLINPVQKSRKAITITSHHDRAIELSR
jgi:hypothetical protein